MPSFTVHGLVPLLFLLSIPRLDRRKVWILWPLTFVPDLDYFLPGGIHRAALGNVFILLPFAAGLAYAWWPGRERRDGLAQWMTIALVYLGSHLVMDVFTGGSVLLYPFSDYTTCYVAGIDVITASNALEPYFEECSYDGIPVVAARYPWMSPWEGAMLAFVLPGGLFMALLNARAYLKARRPAP